MTRIETTPEARSLDDIDADWKIVARNVYGTWSYCGALRHESVYSLAHPVDGPARVSIVTGRDLSGRLCLYARIYPAAGRRAA